MGTERTWAARCHTSTDKKLNTKTIFKKCAGGGGKMAHRAVFAGYAPGLDLRFYDYFVFLIKKTNPYQ